MSNTDFKALFEQLVQAHAEGDDQEFAACRDALNASGLEIRVDVAETTEWEETDSPHYEEAPLVTQEFKVYLGEELLYHGERLFGSELNDRTHTGLGGNWEAIQLDEGDCEHAVAALEDLGHEVDWPEVPAWR